MTVFLSSNDTVFLLQNSIDRRENILSFFLIVLFYFSFTYFSLLGFLNLQSSLDNAQVSISDDALPV